MIKSGQTDWQRRRSDFNHQWLKNRFLSALDAAEQVIQGRIRAAAYWQEFLEIDLHEWQERREDLQTLLVEFEAEMSPRQLFDYSPLSDCESPAMAVLAELMHELWLARYPVKTWLEKAKTASSKVNTHFERLRKIPPVDDAGKAQPEFVSEFEDFRAACRNLSKAIEKFPDRILVT
jgi:hypothetical protein